VILLSAVVLLSAARITVFHLMAVFPAVLFAFYGLPNRTDRLLRGEGSLESILSWTVILCLILGAVIHRPDLKRVLAVWFPLVPFVILLLGAEHRRIFDDSKGMYVVLLFFCGVALMNSFQEARSDLWLYRDFNARRIEFLRQHTAAGDAVIFYDAASLEHACPLFFDRVFLMSNSPGDQERFARRLAERGIDRAYAWTLTPLRIKGFNPYREESLSAFTLSPGAESCSGGSCKERNVYLVRLDTRAVFSTGVGRGGS
jgi:hypothetical protein